MDSAKLSLPKISIQNWELSEDAQKLLDELIPDEPAQPLALMTMQNDDRK